MSIPTITNKNLEELMKKIKPVIRVSRVTNSKGSRLEEDPDGDLYYIKPVEPRKVAFNWDPKPTRLAKSVNPNPYKKIITIHDYGAPSLFKPSIAEVLAQIPEKDIKKCVAFETNLLGFTDSSSYHTAQTRLYEKKR
ncbi:hypothetical protein J4214_03035 [Candidatus Woesearchaeota archaeon]|nr:hypothetical protein [Candidatus Woesearchaeota archaeon]